jgi:hypothetical protein
MQLCVLTGLFLVLPASPYWVLSNSWGGEAITRCDKGSRYRLKIKPVIGGGGPRDIASADTSAKSQRAPEPRIAEGSSARVITPVDSETLALKSPNANPISAPPKVRDGDKLYAWLDLGDVLIDTRVRPLKLMKGAAEYLQNLKTRGYKIGLISNIPADWGQPGHYPSKLEALKDFVQNNWGGTPSFDWKTFDSILLPLTEQERKPASILFQRALEQTRALGRTGFYQGEDAPEIVAAQQNGMAGFQVRYSGEDPVYLAIDDIPEYVRKSGSK